MFRSNTIYSSRKEFHRRTLRFIDRKIFVTFFLLLVFCHFTIYLVVNKFYVERIFHGKPFHYNAKVSNVPRLKLVNYIHVKYL